MASKGKVKKPAKRPPSSPSPLKILIGGNRWVVKQMNETKANEILKDMGRDPEHVGLKGFCDHHTKTIWVGKHCNEEDLMNTILHEGVHAILIEMNSYPGAHELNCSEETVHRLTAELLNFMKQTGGAE